MQSGFVLSLLTHTQLQVLKLVHGRSCIPSASCVYVPLLMCFDGTLHNRQGVAVSQVEGGKPQA
jgi:hypothetical protein